MNFEKFRQMPFSKKIQWILQYYGIWIIVGIVAAYVGITLLNSVINPDPISDICIIILSDDITRDDINMFQSDISELTGKSVTVEVYSPNEEYGLGAFSIKLTSDQLDLVLAPKEQTDQMVSNGYLTEIEEINAYDLYMGITQKARRSDSLDKTIQYFKGMK